MDRSHTPEQTFNRLLAKHVSAWQSDLAGVVPEVTAENCIVQRESWPMSRMEKIPLKPRPHRRPRRSDLPLVVVRFRGRDMLIDGGTRVWCWRHEGRSADVAVDVVEIMETKAGRE